MVQSSKIQYAGEFNIKKCELITHSGNKFDLTQTLVEVNIYENLMSNSINANISFTDDKDAITFFPIVGNEYVKLEIETPESTNSASINFRKHVFVVYKILQKVDIQQASLISLSLTTNEMFSNLRKRVSQSYSGAYSEMVEKIFRDKNYLNSKKQLNLEDTVGGHSLIVPNMHPFAAINMIAQRSFSKNNTSSYLFYETTKSYNFRTLESLFEQGSVFSFVVGEGGDYQDGKVNPMIANLHQVEKNEIISNNDILTNTKLGIYSSKMIVHDIYNKNFSVKTFSYKDEFDKKVDIENLGGSKGHPLFPVNSILDEDNNKISDFSDANLTVQSTSADGNIFATSTYPNHRTPYGKTNPKEDILNRFSKIALLNNGVKHFLEVVGNTVLEVGQIITLKIPKNQTHEKFYDEKLSGNYMITELHHFFSEGGDRKHRIGMTIVKDSIKDGYPDALPKMPKGRGATKKL